MDLRELRERPDEKHTVGPLASPLPFESLAALRAALATDTPVPLAARARALGLEPAYAPGPECFAAACPRFVEAHGHLACGREVLRVGARLWAARRATNATEPGPAGADAPPAPTGRSEWDAQRVLEASRRPYSDPHTPCVARAGSCA